MTDGTPSRNAIRSARRRQRYAARAVLWRSSSLPRVRACGLHVQGTQHDHRTGTQTTRDAMVRLRVADQGVDGRRAGWSGVQSCGSTWACPVCSERIQATRNAEVAAALAVAKSRGWVVGFVTFTVRHKRRHALSEVWAAVSQAWRAATSGSKREWEADCAAFGVRGYLRLTEVTHGRNGWHVHIHALVFLDPAGRVTRPRVRAHGPEGYVVPTAALPGGALGPLTQDEDRRRGFGPWMVGPDTRDEWKRRRALPPLVLAAPVQTPSTRALRNAARDRLRARRAGRPVPAWGDALGLYLRDVEALGDRMGARWAAALDGSPFEPDEHGTDARLVSSPDDLAGYFAKNVYDVVGVTSAAAEVTSSYAKEGRRGNVTPFGLLARIANAPEALDPATGELVPDPDPVDVALWYEWEQNSKGKRQLLWSNGLRADLGLAEPVSEEDAANAEPDGVDVIELDRKAYRRLARAGLGAQALAAAERGLHDLEVFLLTHRIAFEWIRPVTREARAAETWLSLGWVLEDPPPLAT